MSTTLMTRTYITLIALLTCLCLANTSSAQLAAYYGSGTDNACKTIYLVNPSPDSIFYIAGLEQKDLNECQSFNSNNQDLLKSTIYLSSKEKGYLLLLPKDTITYKILVSAEVAHKDKELSLLARYSPSVIPTNKDKKRNRQIKRLPGQMRLVPVIENK
jgi:hypothetical protein